MTDDEFDENLDESSHFTPITKPARNDAVVQKLVQKTPAVSLDCTFCGKTLSRKDKLQNHMNICKFRTSIKQSQDRNGVEEEVDLDESTEMIANVKVERDFDDDLRLKGEEVGIYQ